MDWMTIAEIATAILLAEAVLAAVRWAMDRRRAAGEQSATGYQPPSAHPGWRTA